MAHTRIAQILGVRQVGALHIMTIIDSEGNTLTGVGKDYQVGDPIITFFHDRFNRGKFLPDKQAAPIDIT